ncbi:MAG: DUF3108 domain-containing protein [Candidatus Edwardsbacteria bacterium]|nr:DUF3108 domain-containing protein [Candidatus Edwardsbacteria bacterium]
MKNRALKKALVILLIPAFLAVLAAAQTDSGAAAVNATTQKPPVMKLRLGEKMLFSIEYAGINAGYAYLKVDDELTYSQDLEAYHLVNETWSNPFFSNFYHVHDRAESFVERDNLVSLYFRKKLEEGKYRHEESVVFDHQKNQARYSTGQVIEMAPGSRDVLLSLFYARLFPLEVGRSLYIDNHTDKKNYPLEVKVLKKETLKTALGRVECFMIEPVLRTTGLFENKGRLTVWITNDQRRIPVLMKSKIIIGSVNAVLKEYTPGAD